MQMKQKICRSKVTCCSEQPDRDLISVRQLWSGHVNQIPELRTKKHSHLQSGPQFAPRLTPASFCRTLYWTDWNRDAPKIESASVDGQNRRVVVSDGIGLPNSLTYDSSSGQVCWADAGKHSQLSVTKEFCPDLLKIILLRVFLLLRYEAFGVRFP